MEEDEEVDACCWGPGAWAAIRRPAAVLVDVGLLLFCVCWLWGNEKAELAPKRELATVTAEATAALAWAEALCAACV